MGCTAAFIIAAIGNQIMTGIERLTTLTPELSDPHALRGFLLS